MKRNFIGFILLLIVVFIGCSKGSDRPSGDGNSGGNDNSNNQKTNCLVSRISQLNSGLNPEFVLSVTYNSNYAVSKMIIYDSSSNEKKFEAAFTYITNDSVRLNEHQYMVLDANKRVIRFGTKSDMIHPQSSDDYVFEYVYGANGYLSTKNLYINDSKLPNYTSNYTYTNDKLTGCLMTSPSSGNLKVLESNLTYDDSKKIKSWIYTFPDAIEGYMFLTVLNFGNRPSNPLSKVVTKVYDPTSGVLIDTWTTNYGNYNINDNGNVLYGEANGDLQQGIASFYGKTHFYYDCH